MKMDKRTMNQKKQKSNRKLFGIILFFATLVFFTVFIGRFFYVALGHNVSGINLIKSAQSIYERATTIKAKRGTIYTADKQVIAEDTETYTVYVVLSKNAAPNYLKPQQKPEAAEILSKALNMSYGKVIKILNPDNQELYQVEFNGTSISRETKQIIEKQMAKKNIKGINFTASVARLYPNGVFASHLIGVVKKDESDSDKMLGIMGLEKVFDKQLSGQDGIKTASTDVYGIANPNTKVKARKVKDGDDIYTTLDSRLQTYLETLLSKAQENYHPKNINAVLMNAKTGEILAASQRPTFNAQTREGINDQWANTLFEYTYEPGSPMKVFTMAAAIESGIYNPNATYKSGTYRIDGIPINDWARNWGTLTYRQGFIRSSNVGMAYLEQQMGAKTWEKYIKRFGFLKSTNSGLGKEASGSISFKYPIEQANTAFGQGIDVTVLQMMQGFSAIANGGTMVKPRLVDKIVDPDTDDVVYQSKKEVVGHPVSKETTTQVIDMMRDVVNDPNGTGSPHKMQGYDIAVKTGTAQIANESGNGYLTGEKNYIFSVVGLAPASNPKYILYVTMKQPKSLGTGNTIILSSIFNPLMKRTLDQDEESINGAQTITVKNVVGQSIETAKVQLQETGANVVVVGNGSVVKKQTDVKETLLKGQRVILLTNGTKLMPDISGWSRSDITKLAYLLGVKVSFTGSGYATSQSIVAGTDVTNLKTLDVKLN